MNLGYRLPIGRTVINLAPADLRKDAGAFDLPIALGMLVATGQITADKLDGFASVGELALDGAVRPVTGALSMAMEARARGVTRLIVPAANAREAAVVREVEVYGVGSLADAVGIVTGLGDLEPVSPTTDEVEGKLNQYDIDFADVKGQEFAKRALIGRRGRRAQRHHARLARPGKTMLARRLPTILPPLTPDESLETTRIYSAIGRLAPGESLLSTRPFRSPHHTISDAGMVGGGIDPAAGRDLARPPRRSVPRRAARVQPPQSGSAAPAARRGPRDDQPRGPLDDVPGRLRAGRRDEPVPVRLPRRPEARLQMCPDRGREVHGPHLAGRCSTASTCTSRCRRCRSRICRSPPTAPAARRCASRCTGPARSRRSGSAKARAG